MIVAGLVLMAVGCADLVRQFVAVRYRRLALLITAVAIIVLGVLCAAWPAALLAVAIAAAWIWLFPVGERARASFWPAVGLALLSGGFVAALGAREDAGILGRVWKLPTPLGDLSVDQILLVIGALCILLESGNVIVRAALSSEMPATREADASADLEAATDASDESGDIRPTLKGGRLIGPLERVIVSALTLAGIYTLLAAVLAAKGIVRFPEISRDGDSGDRAEYFLIGSLVSWVLALAAAFLVWWGVLAAR